MNPQRGGITFTQDPVSLAATFADGRQARIDVGHYPNQQLVESLTRALAEIVNVNSGVQSPGSMFWHRQVIGKLARFFSDHGVQGYAGAITPDVLYLFWQSGGSILEGASRRLLKMTRNLPPPHRVSDDVYVHLLSTRVCDDRGRNPLRPYSRGEYARLLEACKSAILNHRVAVKELHDVIASPPGGINPTRDGYLDALNGFARLDGSELLEQEYRDAFLSAINVLAPSKLDALPYRILIGLDTGIPAEGINTFNLSRIRRIGPRSIAVVYDKNRAKGEEQRVLARKGPWSAPELIDEWIETTKSFRETHPSDDFWLTLNRSRWEPQTIDWAGTHRVRSRFIDSHGLKDDSGAPLTLDLRRLRTTWNAVNARNWYGMLPTDPNRSTLVEADHYLFRSQDDEAINTEIESAFTSIRTKAAAQQIHLISEEELLNRAAETPSPAGATENMDMFAAACTAPYDSPFSPKGELCGAAVWNCLVCPNAIFVKSNLANLLRLHDHMIKRWEETTPAQWIDIYAASWVVLTERVLPSFTEQEILNTRANMTGEEPIGFLEVSS